MLPKSLMSVSESKGDSKEEQFQLTGEVKRSSIDIGAEHSNATAKRARSADNSNSSLFLQGTDMDAEVTAHSKEISTDVTEKGRLEETLLKPAGPLDFFIEADAAEDKGSRYTMEDAWVVLLDANMEGSGNLRCAHFAVYDGHGGRQAADYACTHLHANVVAAGLPHELMDIKATKKAIMEGFKRTDEALLHESTAGGWQDGATAVSVWIVGQMVFVANIGDAKAVLARAIPPRKDEEPRTSVDTRSPFENVDCLKGVTVTREHKPIFPSERARIQKAGGYVAENGRVLGRLEVSRAFGDRQFKKVGVIAVPDIHSFELTERERFLILGCDGLWGVFGPSDAVEFVGRQLKEGASVGVACRRLVREAVRERGCKDNCTIVLVVFKHLPEK